MALRNGRYLRVTLSRQRIDSSYKSLIILLDANLHVLSRDSLRT